MRILVIPTTDWVRHPVPNRLNFIFDRLAEHNEVTVCHFQLKKFEHNASRLTKCTLLPMGKKYASDIGFYYITNAPLHLWKLNQLVRCEKFDVIVSANILPSFLVSYINKGVPIAYDYLDYFEESASIYYKSGLRKWLVEKTAAHLVSENIRRATVVITVTSEFAALLRARGAKNVEIISNGVDTKVLKPIDTEKAKSAVGINGTVLGYVGSLEYWLDLELILHALPKLIKKLPDIKLLVVGTSILTDYEQFIEKLATQLNVRDRVKFTGAVPYEHLAEYISAMDICLNPRKMLKMNALTIGGKVFDYLACGKPVVSSRQKALENILTAEDGVFYYSNLSEFVGLLQKILLVEHDRERYRSTAEKYDWDIIARKYEQVLLRYHQ